ncbi:uncharacterized protein B0H18DRAFT_886896, partial [Fomitopsis serialis]|uniref:uncharacterized protein n=1 Tax=Fomitopsis serialis TaxID=139415 RepID=UPI002008DCE0
MVSLLQKWKGAVKGSVRVQKFRSTVKVESQTNKSTIQFPPPPPDKKLVQQVISHFSDAIQPQQHHETGCAVCGLLTPLTKM